MHETSEFYDWRRTMLRRCAYATSLAITLAGRPAAATQDAAAARAQPDLSRIVAIGGAVTETLFALGLGASIVGVDTSSVYPPEATALPQVGYQRNLSAEGILMLRPTVVIVSDDSGPPAVLDQLSEAGVKLLRVPASATLAGARERIVTVGRVTRSESKASALVASLDSRLAAVATAPDPSPRVAFVYARGAGTLTVAGRSNAADEMIHLAGGRNSITSFEGFRPLTSEALVEAAPDVLLFTTRGLESIGGVAGARALPGVSLTPAGRDGRIVAMDDLLLLGFGPRTGEAVSSLVKLLRDPSVAARP